MGGRASFAHGLERISQHVRQTDKWLICLPGTDALDPELTALSTAGVPVAHEAFAYFQFGGVTNYEQLLRFLADHLLAGGFGFDLPAPQPRHGIYRERARRHHAANHWRPLLSLAPAERQHRLRRRADRGDRISRCQRASGVCVFAEGSVATGRTARCAAILRGHHRRPDHNYQLCHGPGQSRWTHHRRVVGRSTGGARRASPPGIGRRWTPRPVGRLAARADATRNRDERGAAGVRRSHHQRADLVQGNAAQRRPPGRTGRQLRATARAYSAHRRPGAAAGGAASQTEPR